MDKAVLDKLYPGDIFATQATGAIRWALTHLIDPPTDRLHFGILDRFEHNGWSTLESTGTFFANTGVRPGRLNWYEGRDLKFYRVNCQAEIRRQVPYEISKFGKSRYDYLLPVKLVGSMIVSFFRILIKERKVRKFRPKDFTYIKDSRLACTELVDLGYEAVGVDIVLPDEAPLPNAYRKAEIEGRITEIEGEKQG